MTIPSILHMNHAHVNLYVNTILIHSILMAGNYSKHKLLTMHELLNAVEVYSASCHE